MFLYGKAAASQVLLIKAAAISKKEGIQYEF